MPLAYLDIQIGDPSVHSAQAQAYANAVDFLATRGEELGFGGMRVEELSEEQAEVVTGCYESEGLVKSK
ncbi:hypothetical protein HK104_008195, partial [Borealophlyctis nickersoniae]